MKDVKIGAVRHPDKDVIAVVFELTEERYNRMVELSTRDNKKFLTNMFTKHLQPRYILSALSAGVKALRRDSRCRM